VTVEKCGGHGRHPVGHAWSGGEHRPAGAAGEPCRRFGSEHGRLLVSDVNDRQRRIRLHRAVINREDMAAAQRKQPLDAVCSRHRDGKLPAVSVEAGFIPVHGRGHAVNLASRPAPREWNDPIPCRHVRRCISNPLPPLPLTAQDGSQLHTGLRAAGFLPGG
jgi:hypothetical protein